MIYVVGSHAISHHIPSYEKTPKDFDLITTSREYNNLKSHFSDKVIAEQEKRWGSILFVSGYKPIEVEIIGKDQTTQDLCDIVDMFYLYKDKTLFSSFEARYVDPLIVLYMKLSHRYLKNSGHFKKTMDDIKFLRSYQREKELRYPIMIDGDAEESARLENWLISREKTTYDYPHPKLNQSKDKFFSDDGVNYIYDHDSIHEAVKVGNAPAYSLIKVDKKDVFCSQEKFYDQPLEIRLDTVLEEAYVLALERVIIPTKYLANPKKAFDTALEKICTSIASGWWREFAWENYDLVRAKYQNDYVDKFRTALMMNVIKPYEKETS